MVYLKSPAIEFRLPPVNDLHVVEEYCHQACYDYIREAYGVYAQIFPEEFEVIEGYTLTDRSFVDREEAYNIAKNTGVLKPMYYGMQRLESYMIKHYGGPFGNE
ncbi:MAG: hypothetical protein J6R47_05030 [Acholeplasmatales bacterium]|nr:hypothetical protein [Acholeplasmatales bacterium]